jgi:hypothetical protein
MSARPIETHINTSKSEVRPNRPTILDRMEIVPLDHRAGPANLYRALSGISA